MVNRQVSYPLLSEIIISVNWELGVRAGKISLKKMYILPKLDEIQLRKLKELNKVVSELLTFYCWDQGEKG